MMVSYDYLLSIIPQNVVTFLFIQDAMKFLVNYSKVHQKKFLSRFSLLFSLKQGKTCYSIYMCCLVYINSAFCWHLLFQFKGQSIIQVVQFLNFWSVSTTFSFVGLILLICFLTFGKVVCWKIKVSPLFIFFLVFFRFFHTRILFIFSFNLHTKYLIFNQVFFEKC